MERDLDAEARSVEISLKGKREADKIPSVFWPTAGTVDEFQIKLAKVLVTASLYSDQKEVAWVNEVVQDGKGIDDFQSSGGARFESLDLKLMYMLTSLIENNCTRLHQRVKTKEQALITKGQTLMKGRQVLWMIRSYYRTNLNMTMVYNITDLVGLQWRGDRDIDGFVYWWDYILATMRSPPNSETLRDILISKLENSGVLKEDIAHFHILPFDDPNRTYEYLRDRLDHFLTRTDLTHNRINQVRDYNKRIGGDHRHHLATPGEEAKSGKKKRGRSRRAKSQPAPETKNDKKKEGEEKPAAPAGVREVPCFFHATGETCYKGDKCRFSHAKVSDEVRKSLKRPERSNSPARKGKGKGRSRSPSNGSGKGRGKRKGKSRTPSRGSSRGSNKSNGSGKGKNKRKASPATKGKGKGKSKDRTCWYHSTKEGCWRGKDCAFTHS